MRILLRSTDNQLGVNFVQLAILLPVLLFLFAAFAKVYSVSTNKSAANQAVDKMSSMPRGVAEPRFSLLDDALEQGAAAGEAALAQSGLNSQKNAELDYWVVKKSDGSYLAAHTIPVAPLAEAWKGSSGNGASGSASVTTEDGTVVYYSPDSNNPAYHFYNQPKTAAGSYAEILRLNPFTLMITGKDNLFSYPVRINSRGTHGMTIPEDTFSMPSDCSDTTNVPADNSAICNLIAGAIPKLSGAPNVIGPGSSQKSYCCECDPSHPMYVSGAEFPNCFQAGPGVGSPGSTPTPAGGGGGGSFPGPSPTPSFDPQRNRWFCPSCYECESLQSCANCKPVTCPDCEKCNSKKNICEPMVCDNECEVCKTGKSCAHKGCPEGYVATDKDPCCKKASACEAIGLLNPPCAAGQLPCYTLKGDKDCCVNDPGYTPQGPCDLPVWNPMKCVYEQILPVSCPPYPQHCCGGGSGDPTQQNNDDDLGDQAEPLPDVPLPDEPFSGGGPGEVPEPPDDPFGGETFGTGDPT